MSRQIVFNQTVSDKIENIAFGDLPREVLYELFKDGRIFAHFMERLLAQWYGLEHVSGCKGHDLINKTNPDDKYEQKTFTENGCKIMPSNMIGQGRKFDKDIFHKKAEKLTYIIVSNINFPNIKIRFVKGSELVSKYPNGIIHRKQHDTFFNENPPAPPPAPDSAPHSPPL